MLDARCVSRDSGALSAISAPMQTSRTDASVVAGADITPSLRIVRDGTCMQRNLTIGVTDDGSPPSSSFGKSSKEVALVSNRE